MRWCQRRENLGASTTARARVLSGVLKAQASTNPELRYVIFVLIVFYCVTY